MSTRLDSEDIDKLATLRGRAPGEWLVGFEYEGEQVAADVTSIVRREEQGEIVIRATDAVIEPVEQEDADA